MGRGFLVQEGLHEKTVLCDLVIIQPYFFQEMQNAEIENKIFMQDGALLYIFRLVKELLANVILSNYCLQIQKLLTTVYRGNISNPTPTK